MAISISCKNCGRVIYARSKMAGKALPCSGCGQPIPVPVLHVPANSSSAGEKPAAIGCPQCGSRLILVRQFHGKNVRCNNCGVVLAVSADPWRLTVVTDVSGASAFGRPIETQFLLPDDVPPLSASTMDGQSPPLPPFPPATPPLPNTGDALNFFTQTVNPPATPDMLVERDRNLNLTDMLIGNEKEHIFFLLPGEQRLDELTIHHRHFFIVRQGITRLTLTTHRVLYTTTRVFSPLYWLLVILFPPLILYYVVRILLNRNVLIPLENVDSVEKKYKPNWLLFILMFLLGNVLATLSAQAVSIYVGGQYQFALFLKINSILAGLLAPALLVLLLTTRVVGIQVRSRNNNFFVQFKSGDRGVSEQHFDSFVQNLYAAVLRVKTFAAQPNFPAT
jgi:DNA-directed RNA polymerase subunit M/transcription elongation factor TFIIS